MRKNILNNFIGQWKAKDGKILVVKKSGQGLLVDFFKDETFKTAERELLNSIKLPSINMKSYLEKTKLIVEVGEEGIGPTLQLEYKEYEAKEYIIPQVVMGLYDDWEDDLGVPWIFPLSIYERI